MRILFVLKQAGYIRHFTSVVTRLARDGHTIRLACQDGEHGLPAALEGQANVSATTCRSKRGDEWAEYVSLLRRSADYLRYLTPQFAGAQKLRARAFEKLIQTLSNGRRDFRPEWAESGLGLAPEEQERLSKLHVMLEARVPADPAIQDFLKREGPDLVLITPLIDIGSGQADYVRACRSLGIPVAMALFSWDNLSTKGLIHEIPDRVFVWNELQVKEAIELHGVPSDKLVVTGAPRFDEFFALKPSLTRERFCELMGLDPGEPTVLYLGSSKFVTENEENFIRRWIDRVRAHPGLARVNVLIKPHPDLNRAWGEEGERIGWKVKGTQVRLRLSRPFPFDRVVVVRSSFTGAQFLYDCLYHSAAAIGLNTSAELEAAIIGRPVLTVRVPGEFADGQESTLHFHYLLSECGGFVQSARDLDEHCEQLERAVGGDVDQEGTKRFVESFLRPGGLERSATAQFVREVERMMKQIAKTWKTSEIEKASGPVVPAEDKRLASRDVIDLDYAPVRIQILATSDPERHWRARPYKKEPWTVEWIERVVGNGAVLYDIGANVGTFTLIAALRQPTATIIAFEPGYASFAHLCDNLVLNGCQGNVIPIGLPLWSQSRIVGFKYRDVAPGQSRHGIRECTPERRMSATSKPYEQPVLAIRLDDLIRQYGLALPTAIKLDVDGGEAHVLEGAVETLRAPGLVSLLVEFDKATEDRVHTLLCRAGFERSNLIERSKENAPSYAEFRRVRG